MSAWRALHVVLADRAAGADRHARLGQRARRLPVDLVMRARGSPAWPRIVVAALAVTAQAQFFSPGSARAPARVSEGLKLQHVPPGAEGPVAQLCLDCHRESTRASRRARAFTATCRPRSVTTAPELPPRSPRARLLDDRLGSRGKNRFRAPARPAGRSRASTRRPSATTCHQRRLIVDASIASCSSNAAEARRRCSAWASGATAATSTSTAGQLARAARPATTKAPGTRPAKFDHQQHRVPAARQAPGGGVRECHPSSSDARIGASTFPAPRAATFMQMKPIEHGTCESCHERSAQGRASAQLRELPLGDGLEGDPHGSRGKDASFHDKTRFPLRGGHVGVACRAAMDRSLGSRRSSRGCRSRQCSDCHQDAHLGQLRRSRPARSPTATSATPSNAFAPPRYELEQHRATRFPLEGGHAAAACRGCHPIDGKLAAGIPAARHKLQRERSGPSDSAWRCCTPKKTLQSCAGCHEDVHDGQFAEDGNKDNCASCHETTSFADLTFDHDTDSRFPLTGKHATTRVRGLPPTERAGPGQTLVRYKPLETACAELPRRPAPGAVPRTRRGTPPDCDFCHETATFKKTLFSHARRALHDVRARRQALEAAVRECHPTVAVADGVTDRALPAACRGPARRATSTSTTASSRGSSREARAADWRRR